MTLVAVVMSLLRPCCNHLIMGLKPMTWAEV